jgi:hypothetical protein
MSQGIECHKKIDGAKTLHLSHVQAYRELLTSSTSESNVFPIIYFVEK